MKIRPYDLVFPVHERPNLSQFATVDYASLEEKTAEHMFRAGQHVSQIGGVRQVCYRKIGFEGVAAASMHPRERWYRIRESLE